LQAQIAANEKGVQELRRLVEHYGLDVVQIYMQHVQDNAEECVRRVIDVLHDGQFTYGWMMAVRLPCRSPSTASKRWAKLTFTGTSPQQFQQLQCPLGGVQGGGALCVSYPGG
jgi:5-oxoprolinase (ATP-hydrolysing)